MKSHSTSLQRRRGATWALLLLLSSASLAAQPPAAPEPPRFEIEMIAVEGAEKISPEIVISESHLEQGGSYTESELRDARYRIVRLPFVLDAEFSLRKGSKRGLYELVITVEDTRRWFFGVDLELIRWAQPISFAGLDTDDYSAAFAGLSGRRFSVGRQGVFFVAAGGEDGSLHLGFTQYDLLDRSILLGVTVSATDCAPEEPSEGPRGGSCLTDLYELGLDPTFSTWTADGHSARVGLDLGVPVRGNQSVRFAGSFRSTSSGFRRQAYEPGSFGFFDFDNLKDLQANLSWVYNSTDEPVFPTAGTSLEAGLNFNALRTDLQSVTLQGLRPDIRASMDSRELGLQITGSRYWSVTRRQTLSAKLGLFLGRSDIENVPTEGRELLTGKLNVARGSFTAGHAKFLRRKRIGSRWRDVRWETDLEFRYEGTSPDFGQSENPVGGYRVGTGIALRNTWGFFRFKLSYLDLEGR
ncbi:MAG: BamA/TamA family outer membrane protein [bacterium]|nr:BamA/TamA family outer membrane protein [bacterium]